MGMGVVHSQQASSHCGIERNAAGIPSLSVHQLHRRPYRTLRRIPHDPPACNQARGAAVVGTCRPARGRRSGTVNRSPHMLSRRSTPAHLAEALHAACRANRLDEIKSLLRARVDVNARDAEGASPLCVAVESGSLSVVQLLSAHGARRAHVREFAGGLFAEEAAEAAEQPHVLAWLRQSRSWATSLHHSPVLEETEVLELLRSGADLHARRYGMTTCPSPLDVALQTLQQQTPSRASQLIVAAAGPWSPATHRLFPPAARQRAVELLLLGQLIVRRNLLGIDAPDGLLDPWLLIIQLDVRRSRPCSR